jgi:hypothetical protein
MFDITAATTPLSGSVSSDVTLGELRPGRFAAHVVRWEILGAATTVERDTFEAMNGCTRPGGEIPPND